MDLCNSESQYYGAALFQRSESQRPAQRAAQDAKEVARFVKVMGDY